MEKTLKDFKDFMHTEEMGWQDFYEWHLRDEEFRKIFEWLTENKSGGDNGSTTNIPPNRDNSQE